MNIQKIIFPFVISFVSLTSWGQDITGDWHGVLKVQGAQLRLVFHINKAETGYSATMDSPDQQAKGIPVTEASYEPPTLKLSVSNLGVEYEGALDADGNITGTFKQAGQSFPLNLSRTPVEKEKRLRPQEPAKPYPYVEEEITFENNEANIRLAGTLTLPEKEGLYPAVVLISGSGPQDRNEELFGHKPFLVIADYLTRNGIAVLRFDDRGTASSSGNFGTATTFDFSTDAEAAVNYLLTRKEINKKQIGLIGHSEGGTIAPMVAARSNDVAFIVLLAGTGIQGNEILLFQTAAIGKAEGMSEESLQALVAANRSVFDIIIQSDDTKKLQTINTRFKELIAKNLAITMGMNEDDYIRQLTMKLINPWTQYFLKYNPATALEKVKCPVLALNGEKDMQVPSKVNLEAIRTALFNGGNKNVTIKELPGLNHLFQECNTGRLGEYETIEQTFSPVALNEIRDWITVQIK
jgi:pimeloyl-ACP methyl ester carboxylesterase